jgi:succinate dehydrogenase hydrophobic anchor subunit
MLIAGFAIWSIEPPEASADLHAARVHGDDGLRDVLEDQLERRQFARKVLLGSLFGGSVLMVAIAFLSMRPSGS